MTILLRTVAYASVHSADVEVRRRRFELFRSVHDQVSRNGWGHPKGRGMLGSRSGKISIRVLTEYSTPSPKPSPNCAPQRLQIVLSSPLYSIDNVGSPALSTALLTEGL